MVVSQNCRNCSKCNILYLIAVGFAVVAADRVVLRGADASTSAELEVEVLHASRKRRNIDMAPKNINEWVMTHGSTLES